MLFYMGETWSFILREEHWLRMCKNRMVMNACGSKMEGVTGDWKCCTVRNVLIYRFITLVSLYVHG